MSTSKYTPNHKVKRTRHGRKSTPEYRAWCDMRNRCYYEKKDHYEYYGGRGIEVCERWRESFDNFLEDMGERPSPRHSLDRIDVNGNYELSNCRWATWEQQVNNRRSNVVLEYDGRKMNATQWSKEVGLPVTAILKRVRRGWSDEDTLTKPLRETKLTRR